MNSAATTGRCSYAITFHSKLIGFFLSKLPIRNVDTVKLGRLPFARVKGKFWLVAYGSFGYIIVKWLFMLFPSESFV